MPSMVASRRWKGACALAPEAVSTSEIRQTILRALRCVQCGIIRRLQPCHTLTKHRTLNIAGQCSAYGGGSDRQWFRLTNMEPRSQTGCPKVCGAERDSQRRPSFHALTGISGISLPRIFIEGSQQIARRRIRQASLQISSSSPTIRTRLTNLRSRTLLSCEPWPVAKLSIKRDALLLLRKLRNAVKVGVG